MGSAKADILDHQEGTANRPFARWLARLGLAILALVLVLGAIAWVSREQIAGNFIDAYLAENGIEASYDIVEIGAQRQVIENLVIGDPGAPDLRVGRIVIDVSYGIGAPSIGAARLESPRVFATYRNGQFSLGALDKVVFAQDGESGGLPAIDVTIVDGGARLDSDYGTVGAYLAGSGRLDDGFAGKLAISAPGLGRDECSVATLTAYGDLAISSGAPRFDGPLRMRKAACLGATLERADIAATLSTDSDFARFEGLMNLASGDLAFGENGVKRISGKANIAFSADAFTLDHDLVLEAVTSPYARMASLRADGALRSDAAFDRSDWTAKIDGEGADFTQATGDALAQFGSAGEGTLIAPLLAKFQQNLDVAMRSGTVGGEVAWRSLDGEHSVVIPEARLRSGTGETVLALSRVSWRAQSGNSAGQLSGNFLTGGAGLPRINGRMERVASGDLALRMTMAEYSAGENRFSVPRLSVRQQRSGAFAFSGAVEASGDLPGGSVTALAVPINGRFDETGGLTLGNRCETVRFGALSLYDLALEGREIQLCPSGDKAMLHYSDTLSIAAQTAEIALEGKLAQTPSTLGASRASFTYPGPFALSDLTVRIGEPDNSVLINAASLTGSFEDGIAGAFEGAAARLDAVPLDLGEMAGQWSYADEALRITGGRFTVTERIDGEARFQPLSSDGATLTLADSVISADAVLRHRASGTPITDLTLRHDLATSTGNARLAVDRLTFGSGFSLQDLTALAKGVVAYTEGSVSGEGRIDWTGDAITSSGAFRSDGLNLAAAFGPIDGLRGEVRFSDLINLTTEPGQVIEIGAINPGIEVLAGRVRFSMTNGEVIEIEDGRWPFMGGELIVRPVTLRYGTDEEQRYTFEIIALDAAKFVSQMELTNLGASGLFDGTVPIVFDNQGNGRIEGGLLISRMPGGNVSYIGELTYEDLGAISNYAFQTLRSLDYSQMSVTLDGDLAGEIITRFQFDGIRQGEGASRNFITRRLAKLPIRFNINVRSENFYELATMVRTFWDPDALPDPVDQGVLNVDGSRFVAPAPLGVRPAPPIPVPAPLPAPLPSNDAPPNETRRPDEPPVQPSESDSLP